MTTTINRDHPCPSCGALDPVPIVYGLPSETLMDEARRGEVELGGCRIVPENPTLACRRCKTRYR